jgi:ureidoglycolate hydrolase
MHILKAQAISCEAFTAFGWLVDASEHAGMTISVRMV